MMNETEIREQLAPRIARKILSRHRANQLTDAMALQLAHEILAMAGAAYLRGQHAGGASPSQESPA